MSADNPAEVFAPGEFLRDEMEAREWSPTDLARMLGWSVGEVNQILAGTRSLTPDTARALGMAIGVDPEFWLNLESAYRQSKVESGK